MLKRSDSRQLTFVFADSPEALQSSGASSRGPQTNLPGQEYLQHQAEVNLPEETDTRATDTGQLLERVAWLPNLARALFKVASNICTVTCKPVKDNVCSIASSQRSIAG
jgi:hypothetical protein